MTSPGGTYVLTVPIGSSSALPKAEAWTVTIHNPDGHLLYEDTSSEFVGYLNVYWSWDGDDRVWLYNSDDGRVWYWERSGG